MLEIKNVSVQFSDENDVQAVEDVSLTVDEGQKIALVGETGSGKSVLLLAILRLLPETAIVKGQVLYKGEDLLSLKKKQLNKIRGAEISYVPQGGGGSMNPLLKVGFQVGEPLMEHKGFTKKQAVQRSVELLKMFRLGNEEQLVHAYPHTFSGGMRQRAMVAMGISAGAKLILADEPSKGLDEKRVSLVVEAFEQLKEESLLCVTHDMMFAGRIFRPHLCPLCGTAGRVWSNRRDTEKSASPIHTGYDFGNTGKWDESFHDGICSASHGLSKLRVPVQASVQILHIKM